MKRVIQIVKVNICLSGEVPAVYLMVALGRGRLARGTGGLGRRNVQDSTFLCTYGFQSLPIVHLTISLLY